LNKRIYLCAFLFSMLNANENVELEKVEVSETISKKDESFEKTKAISTREIDASNTQSLDDIVRSVPGAFTNVDKSQGTINVNIRGMSGFGRVNMMVDGVSQTFYAASSDDGTGNGGTSSFGGLIDPSFITGVDIERGSF
ncbi:TonB-dependent receptor plug domain-containing protein, partial [Campylobacter sp. FMV-PI01]|nr:TonB-dependent receptor plug domain-containing protein [Campylobacter portucalensis]